MATLQEAITPEVRRFCESAGIQDDLARAIELIQCHFPDAQAMRSELVTDPEMYDTWVSLTVSMSGAVSDLTPRDDRFMEQWIAEVPWPAVDKIVVDLDIV
jgi:hypothetical protein